MHHFSFLSNAKLMFAILSIVVFCAVSADETKPNPATVPSSKPVQIQSEMKREDKTSPQIHHEATNDTSSSFQKLLHLVSEKLASSEEDLVKAASVLDEADDESGYEDEEEAGAVKDDDQDNEDQKRNITQPKPGKNLSNFMKNLIFNE